MLERKYDTNWTSGYIYLLISDYLLSFCPFIILKFTRYFPTKSYSTLPSIPGYFKSHAAKSNGQVNKFFEPSSNKINTVNLRVWYDKVGQILVNSQWNQLSNDLSFQINLITLIYLKFLGLLKASRILFDEVLSLFCYPQKIFSFL